MDRHTRAILDERLEAAAVAAVDGYFRHGGAVSGEFGEVQRFLFQTGRRAAIYGGGQVALKHWPENYCLTYPDRIMRLLRQRYDTIRNKLTAEAVRT